MAPLAGLPELVSTMAAGGRALQTADLKGLRGRALQTVDLKPEMR